MEQKIYLDHLAQRGNSPKKQVVLETFTAIFWVFYGVVVFYGSDFSSWGVQFKDWLLGFAVGLSVGLLFVSGAYRLSRRPFLEITSDFLKVRERSFFNSKIHQIPLSPPPNIVFETSQIIIKSSEGKSFTFKAADLTYEQFTRLKQLLSTL